MARRRGDPHSVHRCRASIRPHQRQVGIPASSEPALADAPLGGSPNGPLQCRQRAGARHWPQAKMGAYPLRGTCTSTGSPLSSAWWAAWKACACTFVVPPWRSRAIDSPKDPTASIAGQRAVMVCSLATTSCAHPDSTSSCVSDVREWLAKTMLQPSKAERVVSTSLAWT